VKVNTPRPSKLSISGLSNPEEINNLLRNNNYSKVTFGFDDSVETKSKAESTQINFTENFEEEVDVSKLKDRESGPIIDLVDSIIKKGFEIKASDD